MKRIKTLSFVMLAILGSWSCSAQTNKKQDTKSTASTKVEVYYFHFTARCATCRAVENNAKNALESLYPEQIKKGEYAFKGLNLDDTGTKAIAEKLGVGGQTLLVVCGNKKIDLTSQGFMYAHDPDKIKEEIKKAVDNLIMN